MTEAYPLAWPDGWPRTPAAEQKNGDVAFKRQVDNGRYRSGQPWTFGAARDALLEELWRHTDSAVISSNFDRDRRRHVPIEGRRRPSDQGIAIYFQRRGKPYVMACDRYRDAEGNMRSLALALEAMRQLERHGGGVMMEKAFEGFIALPAPKRPHEILGVAPDADEAAVRKAWRARIADAHPDQTGSHDAAAEVNAARDDMLRRLRA